MVTIYNELTYNEFCQVQTNKNFPAKLVFSFCKNSLDIQWTPIRTNTQGTKKKKDDLY